MAPSILLLLSVANQKLTYFFRQIFIHFSFCKLYKNTMNQWHFFISRLINIYKKGLADVSLRQLLTWGKTKIKNKISPEMREKNKRKSGANVEKTLKFKYLDPGEILEKSGFIQVSWNKATTLPTIYGVLLIRARRQNFQTFKPFPVTHSSHKKVKL